MKRLLFFIVVFMTVALNAQTPWNGKAEEWTKGDGTAEAPFQIETAEQFAYLAAAHTEGNVLPTDNFKLMNNIDMGGAPSQTPRQMWTPIGDFTKPFRAKFNGNGKTIANIYVNIEGPYAGIFGFILYTDISNLGLIGESNISGSHYVGGIVGNFDNSTMSNCYSTANVNGTNAAPGNVGGNVGGITGRCSGTMTNCYNTGNVTGVANFVGGITGYSGTLTNCYNTGNISGSAAYVGGIAGYCLSAIKSCYSVGSIAITGKAVTVGGIAGKSGANAPITNCYQLAGKVTLNGVAGDGFAAGDVKTEAEMKAVAFVTAINAAQEPAVWFSDSKNSNAGFPILKYQVQYTITTVGENGTVTGGGDYANGSTVTLTATPNTNYKFVKWNDGNLDATRVITVIADATYTAEFAPIKYTLTVTAGENGMVTGGGEYDYNTEATLTATANDGYIFLKWSDGNVENPRKVIVTEDATYTAEFKFLVGVNETEEMGLRIYPSPMTDVLRIEGEYTSLEIYNAAGKLVLTSANASTINVSSLSNGVYIIKAYNNDKVGTYKTVK